MFKKATRKQAKLRMALIGPSGSGKTYTALAIAHHLVPGGRIAVIDTERGSASKYAGVDGFEFDVCELDSFHPQKYIEAIRAADEAGYDVLIIDSLSHAWMGKDGALELVDRAAKRMQSPNTWAAWRDVTPLHNALVDAMLQCRMHLIATMRTKTEYVVETNEKGKQVPRKVGLAPIQREGLEYEFDVVADLDLDNNFIVSKTRCKELNGLVVNKAGKEVADILRAWLNDGAPIQESHPAAQATAVQQSEAKPVGRRATEAEVLLFTAAGKPEAAEMYATDRQWQNAVAKYAAMAKFTRYEDLLKVAIEVLEMDPVDVDQLAEEKGVIPFAPEQTPQEVLDAIWQDLLQRKGLGGQRKAG